MPPLGMCWEKNQSNISRNRDQAGRTPGRAEEGGFSRAVGAGRGGPGQAAGPVRCRRGALPEPHGQVRGAGGRGRGAPCGVGAGRSRGMPTGISQRPRASLGGVSGPKGPARRAGHGVFYTDTDLKSPDLCLVLLQRGRFSCWAGIWGVPGVQPGVVIRI